jgi:hypothetical protein
MPDQVRHDEFGLFTSSSTLNVQHRIRYSVNLKKRLNQANLPLETCLPLEDFSDQYSAAFRSPLQRDGLVLKIAKA